MSIPTPRRSSSGAPSGSRTGETVRPIGASRRGLCGLLLGLQLPVGCFAWLSVVVRAGTPATYYCTHALAPLMFITDTRPVKVNGFVVPCEIVMLSRLIARAIENYHHCRRPFRPIEHAIREPEGPRILDHLPHGQRRRDQGVAGRAAWSWELHPDPRQQGPDGVAALGQQGPHAGVARAMGGRHRSGRRAAGRNPERGAGVHARVPKRVRGGRQDGVRTTV